MIEPSPYFQVGEWVEVDIKERPEFNGFFPINNVFLGYRKANTDSPLLTFAYEIKEFEGQLFHGSCFKKIHEPATQTFQEMMEDLLGR